MIFTDELHIITENCELMYPHVVKNNARYCMSCRCWFQHSDKRVLNIYDLPTEREQRISRIARYEDERMLDELRNHHPATPASVAG